MFDDCVVEWLYAYKMGLHSSQQSLEGDKGVFSGVGRFAFALKSQGRGPGQS
jgi:hypothetical protein